MTVPASIARAHRGRTLLVAAGTGAAAGLAGVAAMTATERLEQAVSGRPDSYVPARTLLTLLGKGPTQADQPTVWNHVMHWGTGAALGAVRGMWSVTGLRGAPMSLLHAALRLSFDQTLENTTGMGAPPMTWPAKERLADTTEKVVYSLVTGVVADRLIQPVLASRAGAHSH
jgi:hypothetical protein